MRKRAYKLLVENFSMPVAKITDRIDLGASNPYLSKTCESNPELNRYIKKPKFSRDPWDYDVSRKRLINKFIFIIIKLTFLFFVNLKSKA